MITTTSTLLKALNTVKKAVSANNLTPITNNFYLLAKENKLTVSATNFKIYLQNTIDVNGDIEACIDANMLLSFLADLPEQPITFAVAENQLILTHSAGSAEFANETDEFPKVPEIKTKDTFVINSDVLNEAIYKTAFSVAKDDTRPELSSLLISVNANIVTFAGCDSHVLCAYSYAIESKVKRDLLIGRDNINAFDGLPDNTPISVIVGANNMTMQYDSTLVMLVLNDGKYPDYLNVIPANNDKLLVVHRTSLLQSLSRVKNFSEIKDRKRHLRLDIGVDTIITAEYADLKVKATETLTGLQYTGDNLTIGADVDYLIAALKHFACPELYISFSTPTRAILIREKESHEKENLTLVMPVMLKGI